MEKPVIFRREDKKRRVPNDLGQGVLTDVSLWLLNQTGSRSIHCREACMGLFINIAPLSSESKVNLHEFIEEHLDTTVANLYDVKVIKFSSLSKQSYCDCANFLNYLRNLLCCLDGYKFIVKNNLETVNFDEGVFSETQKFLEKLQTADLSTCLSLIARKSWTFTTLDKDMFVTLKSACILSILKLYNAIIHNELLCRKSNSIWTKEFYKLVAYLVLTPQELGLVNLISTEYTDILVILLNSLPSKLPKTSVASLKSTLMDIIQNYKYSSIDLEKNMSLKQRNLLKGVVLLHSTTVGQDMQLFGHVNSLLETYFRNFGERVSNGTIFINHLQDTSLSYTVALLKFVLAENNSTNKLIDPVHSNLSVQSVEMGKELPFGLYFLNIFAEAVIPAVVRDFETFLKLSLDKNNIKLTIDITMLVLKNVVKDKQYKQSFNEIANCVLKFWSRFAEYFSVSKESITLGMEFLALFVQICHSGSSDMQDWLVDCMIRENGVNCIEIFELLAKITKSDVSEEQSSSLKTLLMLLNEKIASQSSNQEIVTNSFNKLLTFFPVVKSPIIFEYLTEIYVKIPPSVDINNLLRRFMYQLDISVHPLFLEHIYTMVMEKPQHWYTIAKDILSVVFQTCNIDSFEQFFINNIKNMLAILEGNGLEESIVIFILVEILFLRIAIGTEERKDCDICAAAEEPKLLQKLLGFAFNAFKVTDSRGDLLRQYKCHAYNASASIISNSVKKEAFYNKLFKREDKNVDILWHAIVNTEISYDFPKNFDSLPTQKKILVNIRDELRKSRQNAGTMSKSLQYIESQRLFNSSLSEDVTKFDFTNSVLRSESAALKKMQDNRRLQVELFLDSTEINEHECMGTVCSLIQHMFDTGVCQMPFDDEENVALPEWMKGLRSMLLNDTTHKNVKIFLVKVIDNMIDIFNGYAKFFLEPLIKFVVDLSAGNTINYFVTDMLVIISKWASMIPKLSDQEAVLASKLLEFLIKNLERDRQDVFKYNIELLKLIVEAWKKHLRVPTQIIEDFFSTEETSEIGIYVSSVLLVNGLEPWERGEEHRFLALMLKPLNSATRRIYRACAETLGPMMNVLKAEEYVERVSDVLKGMWPIDKYVACMEGVAIKYPLIVDRHHVVRIISTLNQTTSSDRAICLKILLKRLEVSLDILEQLTDFQIVNWNEHIEDSNLDIQIVTLELIKRCLTKFVTYPGFERVVTALARNIYHPNVVFRSCLFDVAIAMYNTKSDHTNTCKSILILGLVDPDMDNQKKIFDFWEDNGVLPRKIIDRFSFLLSELYKSKIEDKLLGLSSYFLVNMLATSDKYDAMIFEHPLEDCNFEDYNLETNWKLQHPSVVPMFAETLDINTLGSMTFSGERDIFALRQTQSTFQFAPTQSFHEQQLSTHTSLQSTLGIDLDTKFKNPNTVNISQKYRVNRRRFLKDRSKISYMMANFETQKKETTEKKRKEAAIEREKKVTIYRSYRKGDFPDVQIALSALLKPLQALALHDSEMSKILFLEIFKGLANKIENNQQFLSSVSDSIKNIFQSSVQFNRYLFAALLDILLKNKEKMVFDTKLISYVAQESGLASTGALLIEEYLISGVGDDMPSTSKRKFREDDRETVSWIKLAELYKELEEWDTVRAIFLEKMDCKRSLQKAITFESKYLYKDAADLYKKLIVSDQSHNRRDFYYDAYFKCFANLGQWETIPNAVATVVGTEDTWTNLWQDEWFQQKLLPWYITSHVKNQLFTQETDVEFLTNLNSCLSDSKSEEYLNTHFSEELCMLWLCEKDMHTAKHYLRISEKNFLEDWQILNPMFQSQRFQKLLKLQNIVEISDFIEIFKSIDDIDRVLQTLKNRWSSIPIEASSSLILSETKLLYRKQFITNILDKISTMSGLDTRLFRKELYKSKVKMDIDLITTATERGNFNMTKKYLVFYEDKEHPKLNVATGVLWLQKSKMVTELNEKMKYHVKAVETFRDNLKRPEDESIKLTTNSKLFDALIDMSELMSSNTNLLTFSEQISSVLGISVNTIADIETYAWNTLKCSVEKCNTEEMDSDVDRNDSSDKFKRIADTYIKLAHFIRNKNDSSLEGEFMLFVLRAMKLNSSEARQLFPCILMVKNLATAHKELFLKETEQIPTWMFLGWIPQLLVNVDSPKVFVVSKLIQRIADTYPQAIMYPYRLSKENYNFKDDGVQSEAEILIERLDKQLLKDEKINKFLKALSYASIPANILIYNVRKIKDSDDINSIKKYIQCVQEDVFNQAYGTNNVNNMQGNMFKSIRRFENIFTRMSDMPINEIKTYAQMILSESDKISNDEPSLLLKEYCPWLANFSANKLNMELEIPGQYDGQKLPVPQHHVKISGFHPEIAVMSSLRKPIKIRMIGMNTKEYPFLIKFGEDIRQDQRIQQLFGLMNNILRNDTSCSNNGLDILTYQVIPLNSNLGLIQWVNDIQSLRNFVIKALTTQSQLGDFSKKIREEYDHFISKGTKGNPFHIYGKAAVAIRKDRVVHNYNSLVKKIPWDIMRTSFWILSTSTENYIALRNNFIKTYSVMCAAHWILGIGDRHLENSSICLRNGKVLGIDFGHSFGTATQILPVPELVPFRLTPHIVSLMEPLKERGPFREYMIHCLKCLRANSSSLLATMNVFIQEPSLDWLEHAEAGDDCQSSTWYPLVKLEQAKRKLNGANCVDIMVEELKAGMRNQQYTDAYVKLVLGETNENFRTKFVGKEGLTVEDQVDCLIDHATDSNLLGRMWRGWCPWV
ncbi:unnamed protein product [Diabrotica balteata]|uniref:non-specific serine/threonine protein kinase n=1 Tax=Diabrotica balteata TaxID=107213 RepID=A0A9N9SZ58_DIABA|nr:unnamed protein product [Diabrotica balteata]